MIRPQNYSDLDQAYMYAWEVLATSDGPKAEGKDVLKMWGELHTRLRSPHRYRR